MTRNRQTAGFGEMATTMTEAVPAPTRRDEGRRLTATVRS